MSKEILARSYDPEVHGQFVAVADHLGNIVDEKRFSFWPEIQGDPDGVYTPLEGTQHKASEFTKNRHPHVSEPQNFTSIPHSHEVASAFGKRTVPKYAALLALEGLHPDKRLQSLMAFNEILTTQEYKADAIDEGVVQTCVGLFVHSSPGVREYAARVVGKLVNLKQGREAISECEGIKELVMLLTDGEANVREAAALALDNVSNFRDGKRDVISSFDEAVTKLVDAMFDTASKDKSSRASSLVVYHVVGTIANITAILTDTAMVKALKAGAVKKLVKLLEPEQNSEPALLVKVLNALWNLSLQEQAKTPIIEADAIPLIVECIANATKNDATDPRIRRYGSGALLSLSVHEKCKVQLQDPFAVHTICRLLYVKVPAEEQTRKNAVSTIHHVCEAPKGQTLYVSQIVEDDRLVLEVFAEKAGAPLVTLLIDDDADMRKFATRAINLLVSEEGGTDGDPSGPGQPVGDRKQGWSHGMCQVLHVVERLIMNCETGDRETASNARDALIILAEQSPRANGELVDAIVAGRLQESDFPSLGMPEEEAAPV
jgi:HEAT repeat protein